MKIFRLTPKNFLPGAWRRERARKKTHSYRAALDADDNIVVTDTATDKVVAVEYTATTDLRTVTAYVPGAGFIGGWHYPHRPQPFQALVASINAGILYPTLHSLPRRFHPTQR